MWLRLAPVGSLPWPCWPSPALSQLPVHGRALGQPWTAEQGPDKPNTQFKGHPLSSGMRQAGRLWAMPWRGAELGNASEKFG